MMPAYVRLLSLGLAIGGAAGLAASQPGASIAPAAGGAVGAESKAPPVATFSIVARDPETGDLGIAVQSKFFAVGAVVPWARAGVGAIATQAFANTTYGPRGLSLLERGFDPSAVLDSLLASDEAADRRQVGIVDSQGRSIAYTGLVVMACTAIALSIGIAQNLLA